MKKNSKNIKKVNSSNKEPSSTTESELSEVDISVLQAIADEGEDGFLIPAGSEKEVTDWLDCTWKRTPCGSSSCPICSRISRDRARAIRKGLDPDSPEAAFESVSADMAEAFMQIKAHAEAEGIDITNLSNVEELPSVKEFPLACEAEEWFVRIHKHLEKEIEREAVWLRTESAADLLWYLGTLTTKVYRQCCNRWHIDRGDDYGVFDYNYTAGVLREVCKTIRDSFEKLRNCAPCLHSIQHEFEAFAKKIKPLAVPFYKNE